MSLVLYLSPRLCHYHRLLLLIPLLFLPLFGLLLLHLQYELTLAFCLGEISLGSFLNLLQLVDPCLKLQHLHALLICLMLRSKHCVKDLVLGGSTFPERELHPQHLRWHALVTPGTQVEVFSLVGVAVPLSIPSPRSLRGKFHAKKCNEIE